MNKKSFIISVLLSAFLVGCTSTQSMDVLKGLSSLFGGPPDRKDLLDSSVQEELKRQFTLCLDGKDEDIELRKQCAQEAYAKVVETKELDKNPDGTVTVREVKDDEVINEDKQEEENEQ